eukprot:CAMPEP_0194066064 /NCGR_PEP_ID=MMETSP0009_2-20130614/85813_1 /TAXON_ID=210454 /ORGANISM="Grammatophora oceanica, Strain CCMP 410" /LENGTH=201 /DNA_ID=CAMNT_0038718979 /DNA_START=343 /DNA_END=948 /DNA_ORIENTATION=-
MEERLKRKAELQKAQGRGVTFGESLKSRSSLMMCGSDRSPSRRRPQSTQAFHVVVKMKSFLVAFVLLLVQSVSGFKSPAIKSSTRTPTTSTLFAGLDRRSFLKQGTSTAAALLVSTIVPVTAWADGELDDLSMPSPEEAEKAAKNAMEERLKRKAELQKAQGRGVTFGESLKGEMEKKKSMDSKTSLEKRNALCEELGRGC